MKREAKKNALIVDSNEHSLWALQAELEEMGFHTLATWSGNEAMELLKAHDFEIMLVDSYLPDLHIADFLKRTRQLAILPSVIVIENSLPKTTHRRQYAALGAVAVVDKHDAPKLRAAVRSCCDDASPVPLRRVASR